MTDRTGPLHLVAAVDGDGWHPAAWREPGARPAELLTAGYWTDLVQEAEPGLLDAVTIEDAFTLQSDDPFTPDDRTNRVRGRLDAVLVASRVAPTTRHIGFLPTAVTTHTEPFRVSKAIATLDYVSSGRAGVRVQRAVRPDLRPGRRRPARHLYRARRAGRRHRAQRTHRDDQRALGGGPPVRPSVVPADHQRAARLLAAGQAFYADVKGRLPRFGRSRDELLILPAATFALGDSEAETQELAHEVRLAQVSPATAIKFLEQLWNRDLSDHDPDGPLPTVDPVPGESTVARGRANVRRNGDPVETANQWRAKAEAEGLTTRELIIEVTGWQSFVGTPATVAATIDEYVQADASDGFILAPHVTDYLGPSLRDHLGLPLRAGGGTSTAVAS